jgi:hypothetical protein
MPDICSKSQTYNVPNKSTGSGITLADFGAKSGQVRTSVSLSSLPHEVGGGSVRIGGGRSFGKNKMSYHKPQYKGKKIR